MVPKKTMITPVARENFTVDISRHALAPASLNAKEAFALVIAQYKKFAVGPYFWFIANLMTGRMDDAGGMTEEIVGIPLPKFLQGGPEQLFQQAHPEDIVQIFAFTNSWIEFFQQLPKEKKKAVHPTIYARLKNNKGLYKWTMIQYADHVFDADDNILYALTVVTDISHIKTEGPALMSILDTSNEVCQHFFCTSANTLETEELTIKLTNREVEVLGYLAAGYSSKQIAAELEVAIKTIDNHRQSLLKKTTSKSTGELVSFAIKAGYI